MGTLEHGGPRGGDQGGIEQFLILLRNEIALTCRVISGNRNSVGALFARAFRNIFRDSQGGSNRRSVTGDAKGNRVKITMSGKFLPYKYYGNEQGIPVYGLKED